MVRYKSDEDENKLKYYVNVEKKYIQYIYAGQGRITTTNVSNFAI